MKEMNGEKEASLRWDQYFSISIITILTGIFLYRMFSEFLIPILIKYDILNIIWNQANAKIVFIWTNTIFLTIMISETMKKRFRLYNKNTTEQANQ